MKKIFFILLLIVLLTGLAIYIFIPSTIRFLVVQAVNVPQWSLYRAVVNEKQWKEWWPAKHESQDTGYFFNERQYRPGKNTFSGKELTIIHKGRNMITHLYILPDSESSVIMEWTGSMRTSHLPVDRIRQYFAIKALKQNLQQILKAFGRYAEEPANLYGIDIRREKVKDTVLLVTEKRFEQEPSIPEIYAMIDRLKQTIARSGARETNAPMMHMTEKNGDYEVMTAVPINQEIPPPAGQQIKRMFAGNILVTEVQGGAQRANEALQSLGVYMDDKKLRSPAKPFFSLVTDRRAEKDSALWITRIYYPVY